MRTCLLVLLVSGALASPRLQAKWSWGGEHKEHFSNFQSIDKTLKDVKETVNRPVLYEVYKDGKLETTTTANSIKDALDEVKKYEQDDDIKVTWMWDDASIFGKSDPLSKMLGSIAEKLAKANRLMRWSKKMTPQETVEDLQKYDAEQQEKANRQVKIQTKSLDLNKVIGNIGYESSEQAIKALEELLVEGTDSKQLEEFRKKEAETDLQEGYAVIWMWADVDGPLGGPEAEKANPFRWSKSRNTSTTIEDLEKQKSEEKNSERPIFLKIKSQYSGKWFVDTKVTNAAEAIDVVGKWNTQGTANELRAKIEEQLKAQGYTVKWQWGEKDKNINELARLDQLRWTEWAKPHDVIETLKTAKRPVLYQFFVEGAELKEARSLDVAIEDIQNTKSEHKVKWMWADASILGEKNKLGKQLAKADPIRWSKLMTASEIIEDMKSAAEKEMQYSVNIKVKQYADDWIVANLRLPSRFAAIEEIQKYPSPPEENYGQSGASHGEEL